MCRLLTAAATFYVGVSLFWINFAPTSVGIGTSHGFYDHWQAVIGWPVVYWYGQVSTPQLGNVTSEFPARVFVHWRSPTALAMDIAAGVLMIVGVALVCRQLCERLRSRRFSLADIGWAVLMAGLAAALFMRRERPADLVWLLAGRVDGPGIAASAWYPPWLLAGARWGAICGVVVLLRCALSAPRMLLQSRRLPRLVCAARCRQRTPL